MLPAPEFFARLDLSSQGGLIERGGMTTTELTARINEIQERMNELHETRREVATRFAFGLGVEDDGQGLNLDELSRWARQVRKFNTELKALADERRELRHKRQELKPRTCDCR